MAQKSIYGQGRCPLESCDKVFDKKSYNQKYCKPAHQLLYHKKIYVEAEEKAKKKGRGRQTKLANSSRQQELLNVMSDREWHSLLFLIIETGNTSVTRTISSLRKQGFVFNKRRSKKQTEYKLKKEKP